MNNEKAYKERVNSLKRTSRQLEIATNKIVFVDDLHFEEKINEIIAAISEEILYLTNELKEIK